MKRKKKEIKKEENLKLVVIFFALVLGLILMSFFFKAAILIQKSIFDSSHRFTFAVSSTLSGQGSKIVSLSSDSKSISVLDISRNLALKDRKTLQRFFEVPIDGYLYFEKTTISDLTPEQILKKALLNQTQVKTNMTIIDLARIWFFLKGGNDNQILQKSVDEVLEEGKIDKLANFLFSDPLIVQEGKTIQIINASDTAGLGNRLSRMITNMGGNVVSVKTSSNLAKTSEIIYFGDQTYTVKKLTQVLGYQLIDGFKENKNGSITEIMIVIGTDKLNSNPF